MTRRYLQRVPALGLASAFLVTLLGCPPRPPSNQPPDANAGPDQSVVVGSIVTLDGSTSTDPDGDPLSFQWQQASGAPEVALTGADTAVASFTAPDQPTTLVFQLTVDDGRGGTASDITLVTVTPNQPPLANAGPDQTVTAGSSVNLNGSASTDPDGAPLAFQWQQTAGAPIVALVNAGTATASFTAPGEATTLTFQLTVNDGQGGTASDETVVTVVTTSISKPILYIANRRINSVTAYDLTTAAEIEGDLPPNANLAGPQTSLDQPTDLLIDNAGNLVVINADNNSITSYPDALDLGQINANLAPSRNVRGAATLLVHPMSMALNRAADLLFVSNEDFGTVLVYAGASTAALDGNLAPLRIITSADMDGPFGIRFGANDELYVASFNLETVAVFANASTLNGTVNASRIIDSPVFSRPHGVFVDENDTLYVVNSGSGAIRRNEVNVFANAATLNGPVMPDSTLVIPGAMNLAGIAVDSAGTGYVADTMADIIFIYDNIANRDGTIEPDRALQGPNTQMGGADQRLYQRVTTERGVAEFGLNTTAGRRAAGGAERRGLAAMHRRTSWPGPARRRSVRP